MDRYWTSSRLAQRKFVTSVLGFFVVLSTFGLIVSLVFAFHSDDFSTQIELYVFSVFLVVVIILPSIAFIASELKDMRRIRRGNYGYSR